MRRWNLIPILSFESQIELVKMNILPRILYLFQTLLIEINDEQFNEWDKLLSRYIWQGKNWEEVSKLFNYQIIRANNKGGLALPCLKDYYISAQLRILVCWCVSDYKAKWKEIEENISGTMPIQARIGHKRLIKCLVETGNKWVKTWLNVITRNDMLEELKILKWCCYDLDFAPNKMDANYRVWVSRGLSSYCTLFNQWTLKSFQKFSTIGTFFRYLQICHHLNSNMLKS